MWRISPNGSWLCAQLAAVKPCFLSGISVLTESIWALGELPACWVHTCTHTQREGWKGESMRVFPYLASAVLRCAQQAAQLGPRCGSHVMRSWEAEDKRLMVPVNPVFYQVQDWVITKGMIPAWSTGPAPLYAVMPAGDP
eukprot:superscaffoldBa00000467_g4935